MLCPPGLCFSAVFFEWLSAIKNLPCPLHKWFCCFRSGHNRWFAYCCSQDNAATQNDIFLDVPKEYITSFAALRLLWPDWQNGTKYTWRQQDRIACNFANGILWSNSFLRCREIAHLSHIKTSIDACQSRCLKNSYSMSQSSLMCRITNRVCFFRKLFIFGIKERGLHALVFHFI